MTRSRMGRPPLFENRVRFVVYLDRRDLHAIQTAAAAEEVSAADWARRRLRAAAQKEDMRMKTKKDRTRRRRRGKEGR